MPFILIEAQCRADAGKLEDIYLKDRRCIQIPSIKEYSLIKHSVAVDLTGLSLQERAKKTISAAHPDEHDSLEKVACERYGKHFLSI